MPFDAVSYVMGTKAGSGGGTSVTVEELNVTENDTYTADAGKAFNPVNVSVPNSYTASDEGKVVSNGALVAQTSDTVTANDTYDTTLINSLTVNVSGGGGTVNKIASGTYVGDDTSQFIVPIGTKMAKTNFVFHMYVPGGTNFTYDGNYKYTEATFVITDTMASYDLSTDGTKTPIYTANNTWSVNGTNITNYSTGYFRTIRNSVTSTAYVNVAESEWPSIIRGESGFSIYYNRNANAWKFVSGMTYYWNVYYFGSDPTNEIVEVS